MRKNASLFMGVAVRAGVDFVGRNAAGDAGSRFFEGGGRCARRVTGAHRSVGKASVDHELRRE